MRKISIECFELLEPDGYGGQNIGVGLVSTEEVAKKWVNRNKGWYRSYHKFVKTYEICDSLDELEQLKRDALVASAKSKLSEEELKALGLE